MAAVAVSSDGGVASLDSDSLSPRVPSPPPDQPHQNNALLGLPIVAIDTILNFLSYDEISLLRLVRKTMSWTAVERAASQHSASALQSHCLVSERARSLQSRHLWKIVPATELKKYDF